MAFQVLKGMKDVMPTESAKWQYVERLMRELCAKHGFCEVRTPVLEHTELFLRGVGSTTDIVQKEMYTFTDKGEGTLPVEFVAHAATLNDDTMPFKIVHFDKST